MISSLPNQPIAFDSSRLRGCCNQDPTECLLVDPADTITFQVHSERCATDTQLVTDPGFDSGEDWRVDGWIIQDGQACYTMPLLSLPSDAGTLEDLSFGPVAGELYEIHIFVASSNTHDGVSVYFGGVLIGNVRDVGEHVFYATAAGPGGLLLVSGLEPGTQICLEAVFIYHRSTDYTLELVDGNDVVVATATYADDPTAFEFFQDRLTVTLDLSELEIPTGCFTLQFTDECDGDTLTSQCVNIAPHDCTVVLTACANGEVMGFKNGFRPQMRVLAELKRPTFEYEFGEEKTSKGRLNRYYAERTRTMELRIGRLGEFGHNFISSLALWDHFYIGQEEYVVTSPAYEPGYEDVYSAHGAILLQVTPYEEDARKVRCDEDNAGCAPPPNYWVQGTGPNEDYILQEETNERILIN